MRKPAVIGLTGGIGSGKSLVASIFAELGIPTLDLDQVGKKVTQLGQLGLKNIIETFGNSILHPDGTLNRKVLADLCFETPEKTQQLNDILHPLIWHEEASWLSQQQAPYVIIEASVLIESGASSRMDAIIVVLASLEVRKQRILQRESYNTQRFEAILARQCDDETRHQAADYLLTNNNSVHSLQKEVAKLHSLLSQLFEKIL